jgi:hypothetical protein
MKVALAVCAMVLGLGVGAAVAQPVYPIYYPIYPVQPVQVLPVQVPDMAGRWIVTTTVTNGNAVDQARLGQGTELYCAQSGTAMTCQSLDGKVILTGGFDGAAVQMRGKWSDAIRMTLDGALANSTLMQGHFDALIAVGLGAYQASGEWRAIKVR